LAFQKNQKKTSISLKKELTMKKILMIAILGTGAIAFADPGITIEVDVFYPEGPMAPKPFEPGYPDITGLN
jgi:hypothetical protein